MNGPCTIIVGQMLVVVISGMRAFVACWIPKIDRIDEIHTSTSHATSMDSRRTPCDVEDI